MKTIIYVNTHKTVTFAVEELRRLLLNTGEKLTISHRQSFHDISDDQLENSIILLLKEEYEKQESSVELAIENDGFAVYESDRITYIVGMEERSLLYGVYYFCKEKYGYQWVSLHEEPPIKERDTNRHTDSWHIENPQFVRRGNIIETINDPHYVRQVIDWGVKNGLNEFFFTFFLWEEVGPYLKEELEKRNVQVTLGGHSLRFLVKEYKDSSENVAFFSATNYGLQELVINKIVAICKRDTVVTRISLWPEDIGINEKEYSDFMSTYIDFMERVKKALLRESLEVEVEHIVYNAGLAWNMLERNESTKASSAIDILYAYWGRDYSKSIEFETPEQLRAKRALEDWNSQAKTNNRTLTVLEYYSDSFMLSELFPPLRKRIKEDLVTYKEEDVSGILNLIVPYHVKKPNSNMAMRYPWKWINQINNYYFAAEAWGKDSKLVQEEFFACVGDNSETYRTLVEKLEEKVAKHTKWNIPLFPARVVDTEKVKLNQNSEDIIEMLDDILLLFEQYPVDVNDDLISIQTKNNYQSFSVEEMLLFYFFYVKKVAETCKEEWESLAQ